MTLIIDIGNTNIVVGLYRESTLKDQFRLATRHSLTSDEVGYFIGGFLQRMKIEDKDIDSIVIASVVPPLTEQFERMASRYFGCIPIMVSAESKLPIKIAIDNPSELGADRIANAVAGYVKFGGPVIIVDFGTAINFDVVDESGVYVGGVLLPGPEASLAALVHRAARLFEVRIEKPDTVVGKSTAGALKSGLYYGTIGQVDYVIDKIIAETGFDQAKIIGTGGLAEGVEKSSRRIRIAEPALTLEGLRIIGEMN